MLLSRKCKAGDPVGILVIHCPEEIIRAQRVEGRMVAEVYRGSTIRKLLRDGWEQSQAQAVADKKVAIAPNDPPKKFGEDKPKSKAKEFDFLALLDGSIGSIEKGLATGKYDKYLDRLLEAEMSGKTRKGAVSALEKRVNR